VSPRHRWRRADGAVLSCADLTEAVPMMLDELNDIVGLVDLVEEWLRFDATAVDQLTDWLAETTCRPATPNATRAVIDELGSVSVKLHRIVRAGIPDTGHIHPPAS
jgi:hypothetical protein